MASVFTGTYAHSLDAKGRVIIPAAYREKLGEGFTVTIDSTNNSLVIYPAERWEVVYQQLIAVRSTDAMGVDYRRYLAANALTDVDMDGQGRVLIPQHLRDAVGLTREVTFVGNLDQVELWDAAKYAEQTRKIRESFQAHLRHMDDTYKNTD